MIGRCMYIWKLAPVIDAEGGADRLIDKARRANISSLWVKVADGASEYSNASGPMKDVFHDLVDRAHSQGLQIWGWQVPHCPTTGDAEAEAELFDKLLQRFSLDGAIMDAEGGTAFFQGGIAEAQAYANAMRAITRALGKPLAISSNDIPQNIAGWLVRFNELARVCDFNFPQTYYGASPSVQNRVDRAERPNAHITAPFVPAGAAFIGLDEGGCQSASACAEKANEFVRLVRQRGYQGHSFWHWAGAPLEFWNVLN
jgi:hypothetical protein